MASSWLDDALATDGFTDPEYLAALHDAARDTDVPGEAVEIGCFMGRSSIAICHGLKARQLGERLTIIDCFSAPPEDPDLGDRFGRIYKPVTKFMRGMERAKADNYWLVNLSSYDDRAWAEVPETIRFAHIDGDHSYEGARNDITRVLARTRPGSRVAVDDYHDRNPDWGVLRAVNEFLLPHGRLVWKSKDGEKIVVEVTR